MTQSFKYLKTWNLPVVTLFIVWCFTLLFAFYYGSTSYEKLQDLFTSLNKRDGILIVLSPILCLILSDVISANNKARLVFWRIHNPLPASQAFTHLAQKDSRISMTSLKSVLGKLPKNPAQQNALWYSIYKRHMSKITVEKAHRAFLLARDLTAIAALFGIIGSSVLFVISHNRMTSLFYFLTMLAQYVALVLVAQNNGKRFVCNVLVECSLENNMHYGT